MDQWEARIVFKPGIVANGIYLSRKREHGVREYMTNKNTIVTARSDEPLKDDPVFAELDDDQLRALQKAISTHGIKPPEASYTQGKLEAVTEHLADMRQLVFKED